MADQRAGPRPAEPLVGALSTYFIPRAKVAGGRFLGERFVWAEMSMQDANWPPSGACNLQETAPSRPNAVCVDCSSALFRSQQIDQDPDYEVERSEERIVDQKPDRIRFV